MRRKRKFQRDILPDPKYSNVAIAKFINYNQDPLVVFDTAMRNVGPLLEVRSRRIGGATYQVPREVRGERRMALTYRWILDAARSKKGKPMHEKLAEELVLAAKNEGSAIKKKIDTHRMADANKAFAHFAW
ncbi:MAG: 30S ribosomal protein S7 [Parcubacteria group bacterium GW2011_GWA1_51_12]|nr:MAG: 30S ribosomal protein S7 [Parcubacteria group bacterium GW2011_GWA1_51_12]